MANPNISSDIVASGLGQEAQQVAAAVRGNQVVLACQNLKFALLMQIPDLLSTPVLEPDTQV